MADCLSCCRNAGAACDIRTALERSLQELTNSREQLRTEKDRLCKLAVTTFSLLGEARVTEAGIDISYFGDTDPEGKLGITGGGIFSNEKQVMAQMHPDDIPAYLRGIEHSLATGAPLGVVFRASDNKGGWRWLKLRASCIEKKGGRYVHWLHDTADITEQKLAEEELKKTVDELHRVKTQLQRENQYLKEESEWSMTDADIIGASEALLRVLRQIELVSATSATVLISGETGTGKELVARAIHQHSDRKNRLFVAVNCAALPATLVESALFGHEKGAFTGANARRAGRFEQADGGTLFLDEVGELPLEIQAKMLRVLQSGEFERVGGDKTLRSDVRVIAASNRDLAQSVREGRFRSDLYHRLAVFPIHVPPLRERPEDIPLLAAYIVTRKSRKLGRKIGDIPAEAMELLTAYDWPGNVRELENVLERAIILSPGDTLSPSSLQMGAATPAQARTRPAPPHTAAPEDDGEATLQEREKAHILRTCLKTSWKIKGPGGAAQILGLNPGTLYSRMKKLGIRRP